MARLPRLCVPGWPHLLIQVGHNRQAVFRDQADRAHFLSLLRETATTSGVVIHAYGLLDSEIRFLGTPSAPDGLSRLMQAIGRRYGSYFNRRHGHVGSLWGGRFKATVIEPERHLLTCTRYVEDLASGADQGTSLGRHAWSSAAHHMGERVDPLIGDHLQYWSLGNTPFEREAAYRESAQRALTLKEVGEIQNAVAKGWPLGSGEFLNQLAVTTDRRLAPLPRGRPPKARNESAPN